MLLIPIYMKLNKEDILFKPDLRCTVLPKVHGLDRVMDPNPKAIKTSSNPLNTPVQSHVPIVKRST